MAIELEQDNVLPK